MPLWLLCIAYAVPFFLLRISRSHFFPVFARPCIGFLARPGECLLAVVLLLGSEHKTHFVIYECCTVALIWVRVPFTKLIFLFVISTLLIDNFLASTHLGSLLASSYDSVCDPHARRFSAVPLPFYDYYCNVNKWFRFVWFPAKCAFASFTLRCLKTMRMCHFEPRREPIKVRLKCHQFDYARSSKLYAHSVFFFCAQLMFAIYFHAFRRIFHHCSLAGVYDSRDISLVTIWLSWLLNRKSHIWLSLSCLSTRRAHFFPICCRNLVFRLFHCKRVVEICGYAYNNN